MKLSALLSNPDSLGAETFSGVELQPPPLVYARGALG